MKRNMRWGTMWRRYLEPLRPQPYGSLDLLEIDHALLTRFGEKLDEHLTIPSGAADAAKWLRGKNKALGVTPIAALQAGRRAEVLGELGWKGYA